MCNHIQNGSIRLHSFLFLFFTADNIDYECAFPLFGRIDLDVRTFKEKNKLTFYTSHVVPKDSTRNKDIYLVILPLTED